VEDEKRSITTIFWLLMAFAFSMAVLSMGAGWAFLEWVGYSEPRQLWPALLMLGIGIVSAIASFVGVIIWLVREAKSERSFEL
jgi:hypothetical protein